MASTGVTGLIIYSVLGDQEHREPCDPVTWLQPHCNCLGQLLVMFPLDHISEPPTFLLDICVHRMCFCLCEVMQTSNCVSYEVFLDSAFLTNQADREDNR